MSFKGVLGKGLALIMVCVMVMCSTYSLAENEYKVYFNNNYRGAPEGIEILVKEGDTVTKPDDPSREGYRFTGWYTNTMANKEYDFSAPVTQSMNLYAGWAQTSVQVTFRMQWEGDNIVQNVSVGDKIVKPDDPVREGYEFAGWYANAMGTQAFDFDKPVGENNVTIYAKWTQSKATVTYVLYDGQEIVETAELGSSLTRPDDPTREEYIFDDWYVGPASMEKFDFTAPIAGNVSIYARWSQTVAMITLNANYADGENATMKVDIGAALADIPALEREGYDFAGWYMDAACEHEFDLSSVIAEDLTLYANWKAHEYTVTLDRNDGSGNTETVNVVYGDSVAFPEDPTREGFDFIGWFMDSEANQMFGADDLVAADVTLYAGWQARSASNEERVYTYMLNYDDQGVYETQKYTSTRRVKAPEVPLRAGYYFGGWSKDPVRADFYDFFSERSTQSITLYAIWLKGYTFEAEYTDFDGKPGQGYSDNCMGTDMILSPRDVVGNGTELGISNGYFVGKTYYNSAFLEFCIQADQEVDNAVLAARLTPDLFDMYFTDETWQVIVNGERIEYGRLNLVGAIQLSDRDENGNPIQGDAFKRPFENYILTTTMHLNAGENVIRLVTNNNNDHGGTFNAETPLIDCLYIYSSTNLSWAKCYPENIGRTVEDITYDITYDIGAE